MRERHVHWTRYILAFGITTLILVTAVLTYLVVDNSRVRLLDLQSRELQTSYDSAQVQQLFLTSTLSSNESCPVLSAVLDASIKQLSASLDDVQRVRASTAINTKELELIERRYLNDNIRYWMFAKKMKTSCNLDIVTILYFTKAKNCVECERQGEVLTYYKRKLKDALLVFPLNIELEEKEPILSVLRAKYTVTTTPGIVIEDQSYIVPLSNQEVKDALSRKYYDTSKLN